MTVVRGVQAHEVHEVAAIVGPLIERGLARQKSYTRAEVMEPWRKAGGSSSSPSRRATAS